MTDTERVNARQTWAKAALAEHEKSYGKTIGARLKRFWEASEGWRHDRATLKGKLPGFDSKSWTVTVAPPSWNSLTEANLDDGVVGPHGDWKSAGNFLPLFQASSDSGDGYILASLADPSWVGFFHEENWERVDKGFRDGVFVLAASLDEFLKGLKPAKAAKGDDDDGDEDDDNGLWDAADSAGGDDEDGGDEGSDDEGDTGGAVPTEPVAFVEDRYDVTVPPEYRRFLTERQFERPAGHYSHLLPGGRDTQAVRFYVLGQLVGVPVPPDLVDEDDDDPCWDENVIGDLADSIGEQRAATCVLFAAFDAGGDGQYIDSGALVIDCKGQTPESPVFYYGDGGLTKVAPSIAAFMASLGPKPARR